ncbi:hypothetical protein Zm00014a_042655 [Zea mays]|uniref:Methyltransferase n=2 Tax=Zea mays TaxID=4577 RepID=A0A317Y2Z2_MAIZE|nr:putative methyltransferase PMT2 [Zea mays]PWZ52999.1 hypothetical protein Zm00014a_042655 [Zea mays]PWZ53000.1 hypothetical protein Zm00014a_042655 [Zea mays]
MEAPELPAQPVDFEGENAEEKERTEEPASGFRLQADTSLASIAPPLAISEESSEVKSGSGGGDGIQTWVNEQTKCAQLPNLSFETHHSASNLLNDTDNSKIEPFKPCDEQYTDYTPCEEQSRAMTFPRDNMIYRERHCPPDKEKLYCLIPAPKGYVAPFRWPKSRDFVHYANVPHKSLTVEKAIQNWVHYEGNVFRFPGGGTQFPQGADKYIDQLASVIPIAEGKVRTALDTGCGVASLGAYLFKKNVLTISFAPRDNHEAQVQFALERGVPAYIGVLGSIKLPFPSRAFDMAHCSRCLIPWSGNDGMYMMEVDRVLRPGGYWVLSGPPIGWKIYYEGWQRSKEDLQNEQRKIEQFAQLLCWKKISEKDGIAIWRKRLNDKSCSMKQYNPKGVKCGLTSDSDVWYKKMEVCIDPLPNVNSVSKVAGGQLEPFPKRLYAVPPRITLGSVPGFSVQSYEEDNKLWQKYVEAYKNTNNLLDTGRYRNIMDMNAGLGSFAAALESPKLWVMNVVPTIANTSTLGVIYERGLIGMYHDWCEGFSTYPRTYDLIHSNGIFSLYQNKCQFEDILLEMDRILRPEGAVIIRDKVDVLVKVEKIANAMRWKTRLADHEGGPLVPEKILFAVKQYWTVAKTSS